MQIAADACIYTNNNFTALQIDGEGKISEVDIKAEPAAAAPTAG